MGQKDHSGVGYTGAPMRIFSHCSTHCRGGVSLKQVEGRYDYRNRILLAHGANFQTQ